MAVLRDQAPPCFFRQVLPSVPFRSDMSRFPTHSGGHLIGFTETDMLRLMILEFGH